MAKTDFTETIGDNTKSSSILNLIQPSTNDNLEVIDCLEAILEEAKSGNIKGICFFVNYKSFKNSIGIVGNYSREPLMALRVADKLKGVLDRRVQSLEEWV